MSASTGITYVGELTLDVGELNYILKQLHNAGPFLKRCNSVARWLVGSSVVLKDKRTRKIYV